MAVLARRARVSPTTVSDIEKARQSPALNITERLARALGVAPEWLAFGVGEAPEWSSRK
jgi:transcriptional regulator with XRE-family HTH domain